MRRMIQNVANKFGYSITKLQPAGITETAFLAMQELCKEVAEPVIFDVGAHHGYICRAFSDIFPRSKIYAFEPFTESFEILRTNTGSDPRISIFNYGLSDQEGFRSFHANSSSATNSLLSTDQSGAKTWGDGLLETEKIVSAQFKTIDSVIKELNIPQIDILKLDVQGAEHLVMRGDASTWMRGGIHLVYSEIITQPTYKDQKRFDESLAVFYDSGFDLHNIYNMSLTGGGRLRQVDVIFTKRA